MIFAFKTLEIRKIKQDGLNLGFKMGRKARSKINPWIEIDEYGDVSSRSQKYLSLAKEFKLHAPAHPPETPRATRETEKQKPTAPTQVTTPTSSINEIFRSIGASLVTQRNDSDQTATHPKGRAQA